MVKEKIAHHSAIPADCLAKHARGLSIAMIMSTSHQTKSTILWRSWSSLAGVVVRYQHSHPPGVIDWNSSLSSGKWKIIGIIIWPRGNLCWWARVMKCRKGYYHRSGMSMSMLCMRGCPSIRLSFSLSICLNACGFKWIHTNFKIHLLIN